MSKHAGTGFFRGGIVSLGLGLILLAGGGCTESEADLAASDITAPQGTTVETLGLPDIGELESRLDLTPEQTEQFAAALENWRSERQRRRDCFQVQRPGGRGGKRGYGRARPVSGEGCVGEPPRLQFLGDAAEILNQEQFLELAAFLTEEQEKRQAERRDRPRDPGLGRGGGGRHVQELGLTEVQAEALREAMQAHHQTVRALFEAYHEGTLTAEGLRDGVKSERAALEQTLAGVLDESQLAQMQARHKERQAKRAERQLERLGQRREGRIASLSRILLLDEAQQAEVQGIFEGLLPRRKMLLETIAVGEIAFEDALFERIQIQEEGEKGLRSVLSDDQEKRFDAVHGMIRPRRGPHR